MASRDAGCKERKEKRVGKWREEGREIRKYKTKSRRKKKSWSVKKAVPSSCQRKSRIQKRNSRAGKDDVEERGGRKGRIGGRLSKEHGGLEEEGR